MKLSIMIAVFFFSILGTNSVQAACDPCVCGLGGDATQEEIEELVKFCCGGNEGDKSVKNICQTTQKALGSFEQNVSLRMCSPGSVGSTKMCPLGQSNCVELNNNCVDAHRSGICGPGQVIETFGCEYGKNVCVEEHEDCVDERTAGTCPPGKIVTHLNCRKGYNRCINKAKDCSHQ